MDTDELTAAAWDVLRAAAEVSETLYVELGAMSRPCKTEEEWLDAVNRHLQEIVADPEDYCDFWNLAEVENVIPAQLRKGAARLSRRIAEVMARPWVERGACFDGHDLPVAPGVFIPNQDTDTDGP